MMAAVLVVLLLLFVRNADARGVKGTAGAKLPLSNDAPRALSARAASLTAPANYNATRARRRLSVVDYEERARLVASNATTGNGFGSSAATSGDLVAIGAFGAVYIFRTDDGGTTWSQVAKLVASDGGSIGSSVAIDGDVVASGAPGCRSEWDSGLQCSSTGAVYVFHTTDGGATYVQVAKLTADGIADGSLFGYSVAIDGDMVVVGAPNEDSNPGQWHNSGLDRLLPRRQYKCGSGAVYIFRASNRSAFYAQTAKLTAADAAAGDYFGHSLAIDGGTIAIGAPQPGYYNFTAKPEQECKLDPLTLLCDPIAHGLERKDGEVAVRLTLMDCPGTIGREGKYPSGPGTDAPNARRWQRNESWIFWFGAGGAEAPGGACFKAVVPGDLTATPPIDPQLAWQYFSRGSGSVYIFRAEDNGTTYVQRAKLAAADAAANDQFGYSVAIDGAVVAIGAHQPGYFTRENPLQLNYTWVNRGSVYIFRTENGGTTYVQEAKLTSEPTPKMGSAVACTGACSQTLELFLTNHSIPEYDLRWNLRMDPKEGYISSSSAASVFAHDRCLPGTFSADGSTYNDPCIDCPAGKFAGTGSTACEFCETAAPLPSGRC